MRVVAEGGNLGFTQAARIEFARAGGLVNTDFIDNSGGVDCSDREVNIKILLDGEVADGDLTRKQRDALLAEMTEEVADLVLATTTSRRRPWPGPWRRPGSPVPATWASSVPWSRPGGSSGARPR